MSKLEQISFLKGENLNRRYIVSRDVDVTFSFKRVEFFGYAYDREHEYSFGVKYDPFANRRKWKFMVGVHLPIHIKSAIVRRLKKLV